MPILNIHIVKTLLIPIFVGVICIVIMRSDFTPPVESHTIGNADFYSCKNQFLKKTSFPDNWRSDTRNELECGVYEFNFNVVDDSEPISILIPSYRFNIKFYMNGIKLEESKGRRNQVLPFYSEVPTQVLKKGENKIRLELLSTPTGEGFIEQVIIGRPAKLATLERKISLFHYTLPQIIAVIVLISAGISLFLFIVERKAVEFLYFSLMSLGWVVNIFNLIWTEPLFSTYVWMKFVFCALLTFATFGCLFVGAFLGVKFPRIDNVIKFMALVWFPVLIFLPSHMSLFVGQYLLMPYILAVGFLTVYKFFSKLKSSSILSIGDMYLALNTAIIVTGIHDVGLMMNVIDNSITFYLNYSAAMLIICIWFHMLSKYFRLIKLEQNFSNVLSNELSAQKRNLEASLKREKKVIEKNAALNERDNLMRDLHDSMGSRLMSLIRLSSNESKTKKLAQETLDELRFMTTPLRIEDCDIVTLLAAFREQRLNRLEEIGYDVNWSVQHIPEPPQWNIREAMEFLRILDELLGNALKHGTDEGLSISLAQRHQLILSFANTVDNESVDKTVGAGLDNIHLRSKKIGSTFISEIKENQFLAELRW